MNTAAPTRPEHAAPTDPTDQPDRSERAAEAAAPHGAAEAARHAVVAEPAAVGAARRQVQATIQFWDVPVDASVAMLLTSELVTNAVTHETGESITLVITCAYGQLHVDVHDTSSALPVPMDGPP